jgi:hypothetical protein
MVDSDKIYSGYFFQTCYIAFWGRHSGGAELKASPQERLIELVLILKVRLF